MRRWRACDGQVCLYGRVSTARLFATPRTTTANVWSLCPSARSTAWPRCSVTLRASSSSCSTQADVDQLYWRRSVVAAVIGLWVRKFPTENFRKFILIFPQISINLSITYVNRLLPSPALQIDAVEKHVLDKQLSRSLCFNFMHYVQKKITCF